MGDNKYRQCPFKYNNKNNSSIAVMYNNEYHVLSNGDFEKILIYTFFSLVGLLPLFSYLAKRDASTVGTRNTLLRKFIPWFSLCFLLSDITLLIYRCIAYQWEVVPQPSQASAFRELRYMVSGYILWGWANDDQLPVLTSLSGVILWSCWTIYSFNFKPSDTSWWKKVCKIIAYFIISITILGFQIHQFGDLWIYAIVFIIVMILLCIAHVKSDKQLASSVLEPIDEPLQNPQPQEKMFEEGLQNEETFVEIETQSFDVVESNKPPMKSVDNSILQTNEFEMMYCKHCGRRIELDSTYCKYCGKRL